MTTLREPVRARLPETLSPADQGAVARRAAALGAAQPMPRGIAHKGAGGCFPTSRRKVIGWFLQQQQ